MQSRSQATVEVDIDAALAASLSGRSSEIIQLTREALSNVARHSQATRASLRLARRGSEALLVLEDNGVGFDTSSDSNGFGMSNMRARAEHLGGTLVVESETGKGTTLRITFPI